MDIDQLSRMNDTLTVEMIQILLENVKDYTGRHHTRITDEDAEVMKGRILEKVTALFILIRRREPTFDEQMAMLRYI